MNENSVTLALVGRLVRHRWPVLLVLAVLGAVVGGVSSLVLSPGYVSSSKVLLQGVRDTKQLPGEAQIATSLIVLDRTANALGWGVTGTSLQDVVSATVADGNVIEISGAASTPERAQKLTEQATADYITFSTQIATDTANASVEVTQWNRDATQQRIDEANRRINELQASPALGSPGVDGQQVRDELERQRQVSVAAGKELDEIDDRAQNAELSASLGRAGMRVIEPPLMPTGPASPTIPELAVGGAVLLVVIGILAHLVALRFDRRLRDGAEIAAAVGAPVVATVEVEWEAQSRSALGRLLHDDRQWADTQLAGSDDDRGRLSRHRRVLSRLRVGNEPLSLVVLHIDDDSVSRAAVVDLAMAVATAGESISVTADSDSLVEAVRAAADAGGVSARVTVGPDRLHQRGQTALRVVAVAPARPDVPDVDLISGSILVLAIATRTGWELARIAGACVDAGMPLSGVLVAVPRPREKDRRARPGGDAAVGGEVTAGLA